jgi:hypothetical protein
MKFEFDRIMRRITCEDCDEPIEFRCSNPYQYNELAEILLSPSQNLIHMEYDRTFTVSKTRLESAKKYMENNKWNKKN